MDYTNKDNRKEEGILRLVFGDCILGVHGTDFSYLFSYQFGGMESMVIRGKEWLYCIPRPAFWRATTDNDRGSKFSLKSGMWLSADMFIECAGIKVFVDDKKLDEFIAPANNQFSGNERASKVKVIFTYKTITIPATIVEVAYEVGAAGDIKVDIHYFGNRELPQLPVFGMRFIFPTKAIGYTYEGLSGETYPDRMEGGSYGIHQVKGLPVTKYLVPQDCNVHMETKWFEVYRDTTRDNSDKGKDAFGIRFSCVGRKFAFSCIPYTAEELENATHLEELPHSRRTVVSVLGAVRGVGGINSWGADVEEDYQIDAGEDICYSFRISPQV